MQKTNRSNNRMPRRNLMLQSQQRLRSDRGVDQPVPGRIHESPVLRFADVLHLQRTLGNRATQELLAKRKQQPRATQSSAARPAIQRKFVKIVTGDANDFTSTQKDMEQYIGEPVEDLADVNFARVNEGETLHIWAHMGSKIGGMTAEQLAKALVEKKLYTCKQIILVGCGNRDQPEILVQSLGDALYKELDPILNSEQRKPGTVVRPRIPIYGTRGTLHGPYKNQKDQPVLAVTLKTEAHNVLKRERAEAWQKLQDELTENEKLFDTVSKYKNLSWLAPVKPNRAKEEKEFKETWSKKLGDIEDKMLIKGEYKELLLPPDKDGVRHVNPEAVVSYIRKPDQYDIIESKITGKTEKEKAMIRSNADYALRKAMIHGKAFKDQFLDRMQEIFSGNAIKLMKDIQQWCDQKEGVDRRNKR